MKELIIDDIKKRLKIDINDIKDFDDGATDSLVFCVNGKYLIKTLEKNEFDVQKEFLNYYDSDFFQKIIYSNEDLLYVCYEFIEGNKIKNFSNISIIEQIYEIVSSFKKYDYDGYGYLFEDHKTWQDFLSDEVEYSSQKISGVSRSKVNKAIQIVGNYEIDKYLIHGDFGTHNFVVKNGLIKIIDPMGVVGDPLYDFYFAIFSNVTIFRNMNILSILSYFGGDMKYKKALLVIVFYIRMSRSYVYDRDNFDIYLNYYNEISL